jgi:hypothetical protein
VRLAAAGGGGHWGRGSAPRPPCCSHPPPQPNPPQPNPPNPHPLTAAAATPPQATDCVYSGAYAILFATALGVSVSATGAPEGLHLLNLLPVATAAVDVVENSLMLAMLAQPREAVARVVVHASTIKWLLLAATAAVVAGTGAFCVAKGAKGGKKARREDDADGARDVAARAGRKSARRA